MKTKIDIFSGFLGAGKTRLIKKLIDEKLYKENIVIIENEFGEISIDGATLKKSNVKVKEINAGCICCTVNGDFNKSIKEIMENFTPNRIIIEPSGVAKLSEILDIFKNHELKEQISINMVITLVDVLKFNTYINNFSDFYKNQIINAKTITLTRVEGLSSENLINIIENIKKLNPKASIIRTSITNLLADEIIKIAEKPINKSNIKSFSPLKFSKNKLTVKSLKKTKNVTFQSLSIKTSRSFSEEDLKSILCEIETSKNYGNILRIKGILKSKNHTCIQFDYVPNELTSHIDLDESLGKLCIIGTNLNKLKLKNLFL